MTNTQELLEQSSLVYAFRRMSKSPFWVSDLVHAMFILRAQVYSILILFLSEIKTFALFSSAVSKV